MRKIYKSSTDVRAAFNYAEILSFGLFLLSTPCIHNDLMRQEFNYHALKFDPEAAKRNIASALHVFVCGLRYLIRFVIKIIIFDRIIGYGGVEEFGLCPVRTNSHNVYSAGRKFPVYCA